MKLSWLLINLTPSEPPVSTETAFAGYSMTLSFQKEIVLKKFCGTNFCIYAYMSDFEENSSAWIMSN